MKHPTFDLVPMIIGRGGCNVRGISDPTNTKIRLRGQGSGHMELPSGKEAPAPLMVVVSSDGDNDTGFREGVRLTIEMLHVVEKRYRQHCEKNGCPDSAPGFVLGPPFDKRGNGRKSKHEPNNAIHRVLAGVVDSLQQHWPNTYEHHPSSEDSRCHTVVPELAEPSGHHHKSKKGGYLRYLQQSMVHSTVQDWKQAPDPWYRDPAVEHWGNDAWAEANFYTDSNGRHADARDGAPPGLMYAASHSSDAYSPDTYADAYRDAFIQPR